MDDDMEKEIGKGFTKIIAGVIVLILLFVGLMAFLYVYPGTGGYNSPYCPPPLGLEAQRCMPPTFLVSSAPDGAMVKGSIFVIIHNDNISQIDKITIYNSTGVMVAFCDGNEPWHYVNNASADTLEYRPGMKIVVEYNDISSGDSLTITSSEDYFGVTECDV